MRPRHRATGHTHPASEPRHSLWRTLVVTGAMIATVFLALLSASAPWTAAAIVVSAVVAYAAGRTLLRRRRGGRTRTVCLPRTEVCVGV